MGDIKLFSPLKEIIENIHGKLTEINLEISNLELRIANMETGYKENTDKLKQIEDEVNHQI